MKKIIFLFAVLVVMNGCAQSTSFVGPTYTMVKSGSMIQAGNSFAASYGFTKLTGATPGDVAISLTKNDKFETFASETIRECQTFHSSTLNEIFFDTLDGINCLRDPFSIIK